MSLDRLKFFHVVEQGHHTVSIQFGASHFLQRGAGFFVALSRFVGTAAGESVENIRDGADSCLDRNPPASE